MLMDMCLPKFEIYQDTVAPNCFKSHTNSFLMSGLKWKVLDIDKWKFWDTVGID